MDSVIDISAAAIERKEPPARALTLSADINPAQMLAIAVQKGADLETLRQFMDLQERWEANQARKAFEAAISAAKAEIKPVLKRSEVDFTSQKGRTHYKYEDFAEIAEEIDPILGKHGLSYRHRSKQNGKSLTIICKLAHRDGHFEEVELTAENDESGNKNSIQGVGSTATYLQRYTLKLAMGLSASKDNDGRGAGKRAETISEDQIANLEALLSEVGANKINFMRWARVHSLDQILACNYEFCVKAIEAKRQ
jgi:hypothetical protein